MSFKRGDWVVFEDAGKREIGRVWSTRFGHVFVCYHEGCTAASTPTELLRPWDSQTDADLYQDPKIGFHRFDDKCPKYDPDICGDCK